MFKLPRGTKDILTDECLIRQRIEELARKVFNTFGYSEISTPIIENTGLFIRSLGLASDIVTKQIFKVSAEKERNSKLCLRPEGTAGIIRSYIEHNLHKKIGLTKLFYIGQMFRAERPQKGRLRQFHHIGAEAIGVSSVYLDVEIIGLSLSILDELGIADYTTRINSLGCSQDREKISQLLKKNIQPITQKLCPDCKNRFKRNILRILDCKNKICKEILRNTLDKAGFGSELYLCKDCLLDINLLKQTLDTLEIKYVFDQFLVRGLDYYTKTVFEINHPKLGAQDAIGAGGRYDNLVKDLGGPDVGAVGFGLGMERLIIAGDFLELGKKDKLSIYIVGLGEDSKKMAMHLLRQLRKQGVSSDTDYEHKSLKGQLRRANDLGAKFVGILGEDELKKDVIALKDMSSGAQEEIGITNFTEEIKRRLNFGNG